MAAAGFRDEDWMELPREEESHDVIPPPRVTNILSSSAALSINLGDEEPDVPEARPIESLIRTEMVASVSTPSQPTYLLPSSIKSKIVAADLERIKTIYGILEKYQLRVAQKRERADWKSLGWVCFYEVVHIRFQVSVPQLDKGILCLFWD